MEKGPSGDFYDKLQLSRMVTTGPTCTRRMENDPTGTRRMEKGPSGRLYDELQASRMNNCRFHSHTSDGERTVWRFMTKCHSLQIKNFVIDV